jgi:hypothetical protein
MIGPMLTSNGVFDALFDGQFEQAPQAPLRRFVIASHIRRAKNAAAANTIKMTRISCMPS